MITIEPILKSHKTAAIKACNDIVNFIKVKKTDARKTCIEAVNFVRVKILEKPELNTPEKRLRDELDRSKGLVSFDKILKNVHTAHNKLQIDTVELMISQFRIKHGNLCNDKYIELRESLALRKEQLCM
jgi:adenylate cyclase class IV